jgi:hypothetical protein
MNMGIFLGGAGGAGVGVVLHLFCTFFFIISN